MRNAHCTIFQPGVKYFNDLFMFTYFFGSTHLKEKKRNFFFQFRAQQFGTNMIGMMVI